MVRMVAQSGDSKQPPAPRRSAAKPATKPARVDRRRWWVAPLLVVLAFGCLGSGWFGYKVASATNRIFTDNTTGGSPILQGKKPKNDGDSHINILLIGIGGPEHESPNLSDTIQVVSIDAKSKQVAMLSIPRDLYVQVPDSTSKARINEVHYYGEENGAEGGGPGLLKKQVGGMLDVPIHYFVRIDFNGFRQLIDAIGGIDVTVEERLYDPFYPAGETTGYTVVNISPGLQHMNGETALRYARSRQTSSDFARSKRQQQVLVAARDKAQSLAYLTNPGKISQFIDILGGRVKTDLSISESERLAKMIKDIPATSITSKVLDNTPEGLLYDSTGPGGAYILLPRSGDYSDIRDLANQLFASSAIKTEAARVELQNASGSDGLAATEQERLTKYGYGIIGATNAPAPAAKTIIYDYTGGNKQQTLNYLKKRYNAEVIEQSKEQGAGVDLRIVIGSAAAEALTEPASPNGFGSGFNSNFNQPTTTARRR